MLSLAAATAFLLQSMVYAAIRYPLYAYPKPIEEAADWLNRNAPLDSVVATLDPSTTLLIPMLTRCKVLAAYDNPFGASDLPRAENAGRFRLALRLFGVSLDQAAHAKSRLGFFGPYTLPDAAAVEAVPGRIALDYFWLGPLEKDLIGGRRPAFANTRPLFANAEVAIYRAP